MSVTVAPKVFPTWSNCQEVAWLALLAAWWLNLYPGINATEPRETHTGEFNHFRAGCRRIEAIDLIPEGTGVVSPPIVNLIGGFCQTFAPYMSGTLPTTPDNVNSCSFGGATSAGIVKSGKS